MAEASLSVDVDIDAPGWAGCEDVLARALNAAAAAEGVSGAISLLLTHDAAIAELNGQWRGKPAPTNVLSFPAPSTGQGAPAFLGDIALAAETIAREAEAQGKSLEHHAMHLVVHGFLHLLGYDHESDAEAEIMEARERAILAPLGVADPYAEMETIEPRR